jgi:glycosyltransferase involved in cell wall biosynthesis
VKFTETPPRAGVAPRLAEMTKRIHVAVVLPVYWPVIGGCEIHTHELVGRLSRRNQVHVITTISRAEDKKLGGWFMLAPLMAAGRHDERYTDGQAQVTRVGLWKPWKACLFTLLRACGSEKLSPRVCHWAGALFIAGYKRKLRKLVGRPDVIHAINGDVPWLSYAAMQVARELGVPFAFTGVPHIYNVNKVIGGVYEQDWAVTLADMPPQLTGVFGEFFMRTSRAADLLFTMTDGEKAYFLQNGVNKNVHTVGVGPVLSPRPAPGVREAYGIPEKSPLVLFLGRVNVDKGVVPMIAAAKLVWREIPDAHFLFVGPFEWGSEALFTMEPDRRVIATGAVDLEQKTGALATCDLLCVPSVHETLGGIYLEAWSFGKPVVGANIPPFRELTGNGQGGVAVEPTPEGVARGILFLLRSRETGRRMGVWGSDRVKRQYNWEIIAGKVEDCYGEVLRSRGAGAGQGLAPANT